MHWNPLLPQQQTYKRLEMKQHPTPQEAPRTEYFSVHHVPTMEARPYQFSRIRSNIQNTPEKLLKATELFPAPTYYFEFHSSKHETKPVITQP